MRRETYNWRLPDAIKRRLGPDTYGRQRIIHEGNDLLMILHSLPDETTRERDHMVFWLRGTDGKLLCNGASNGPFELRTLLESYEN